MSIKKVVVAVSAIVAILGIAITAMSIPEME